MIWEALLASPAFLGEIGVDALRRQEDAYWAAWPVKRDPAFIAVDGAEDARGAIVLKPESSENVRGWRLGLGVRAVARRAGAGLELVKHAIEFARGNGATYVSLLVDPANLGAIALYERTGFDRVASSSSTALRMRLTLR